MSVKFHHKIIFTLTSLILLGIFTLQLFLPAAILPADAQTQEVVLDTKYPELKGTATNDFKFDIDVRYVGGTEPRNFNLNVKGPPQYFYSIQQSYGSSLTEIASIKLDPNLSYGESLSLNVTPNILNMPEPGTYTITFEVASEDIIGTLDVKIIVTARYGIDISTPDGVLSGQINPGKDNIFKINVKNTGSSDLENVNLSSYIRGAPKGWDLTFEPDKIDNLAPNNTREVKFTIKPSTKTISGDYEIVVTAKPENSTTSKDLTLRVTVLTRTIWGWVGVGIVVLVVAGLIAMFIFLGRR